MAKTTEQPFDPQADSAAAALADIARMPEILRGAERTLSGRVNSLAALNSRLNETIVERDAKIGELIAAKEQAARQFEIDRAASAAKLENARIEFEAAKAKADSLQRRLDNVKNTLS